MPKIRVICHQMDTVTAARRIKIVWQQSVEDMVSRGAEGSGSDMAEVVAYLTKYFGKINVNTATIEQLLDFPGLPGNEARTVAAYRDRNGVFKDFAQLNAVRDENTGKLQEKRGLIAFSL